MATAAATKNTESAIPGMEVEDSLNGLSLRGRVRDPLIPQIRTELEKCLSDKKIRSFKDIPDQKEREKMARKVRDAGKMITDTHDSAIEVLTRYDEGAKKMYWGPTEVMKSLS